MRLHLQPLFSRARRRIRFVMFRFEGWSSRTEARPRAFELVSGELRNQTRMVSGLAAEAAGSSPCHPSCLPMETFPTDPSGVSRPIQVENQHGSVDAERNLRGGCQPIAIRTPFSTLRVHLESDASGHIFLLVFSVSFRTTTSTARSANCCEIRLANNSGPSKS